MKYFVIILFLVSLIFMVYMKKRKFETARKRIVGINNYNKERYKYR